MRMTMKAVYLARRVPPLVRAAITAINPHFPTRPRAAAIRLSTITSLPPFEKSKKIECVQRPTPEWDFGTKSPPTRGLLEEEAETTIRRRWDMETLSKEKCKLLDSAVIPRPLALVSTMSPTGDTNLALFSCFSLVSHDPPMLSLSLPGVRPETRTNILSTRQFTINLVDENLVEHAHCASIPSAPYVDEWALSGLHKEPSRMVRPPVVRESPICIECELYSFQDICKSNSADIAATIVLGSIKYMHIRADVLDADEETVTLSAFRPVGKLGGNTYARLVEVFDLPTPSCNHHEDDRRYNGLLG